jgi:myo-inositol-1(or 4)-monophosphatase
MSDQLDRGPMGDAQSPARVSVVRRAAEAGAAVAESSFRAGIDVETKSGKTDVVTGADRAAQRRVVEVIQDHYPDDVVVGEEEDAAKVVPNEGAAWVIDPIDGTNNYVRDIRDWATAVAAVVDGEAVAACNAMPALGDTYVADDTGTRLNGTPVSVSEVVDPERGAVSPTIWWAPDRREEYARACETIVSRFADLRRFGSAQVTLGMVAAGSLEGTITNVETNPWDTISGVHLVRQASGRVTGLDGERWTHESRGLVASNGHLHDEVLAAARDIDDAR